MDEINGSINVMLSKQSELTDCIYGIVQYIIELSNKQNAIKKYQTNELDDVSEDSEEITFQDIANYFPYLKNLEQQIIDPEDFCQF